MMDQDELLTLVARAYLRAVDKEADFGIAALASEAGVEPFHITAAIDVLRARGWIEGHPAHGLRSTRDGTAAIRNFVNPLPKRKLSEAEAAASVATAFLARARADREVNIRDLATDTSLGLGAIKRIVARWEDASFGITVEGDDWTSWTADTLDHLAEVADPLVEWGGDTAHLEVHHHGDRVTGDKVNVTIDNSHVGTVATGKNARAIGTVNVGTNVAEAVKLALASARRALAEAEPSMSDDEHEAFHQLLRIVRSTQIEVAELATVQRQMKDAVEDLYASNKGEALRAGASGAAIEFVKLLASSPAFAELAKALLQGMAS